MGERKSVDSLKLA